MFPMEVLYTTRFETPFGSLRVVSSEKGLVYIELPNESGRGFEGWKKTHAPDAKVVERRTTHDELIDQLLEYAGGERRVFQMDLDLRATPFQLSVYKVVAKIGHGETLSYSAVADAIGNPKAVRAVGAANGANPIPIVIPCHRVVSKGGIGGYAFGVEAKRCLLKLENQNPMKR